MNKHERYNRSEKGKARYARYRATHRGVTNEIKVHSRWNLTRTKERINELESLLRIQIQKYVELVNAKEN